MKFTVTAIAVITLSQAHAYEPACPPAQTVTVTQTVQPVPSYIPQGNDNYGPGKHYPGGPYKGKPWGSQKPHRPNQPRPDYPSTSIVTQTSYAGPYVPPVTQTSTITCSSTVSASQTLYYPPAAATHTVIVGGKDSTGAPVLKFDPEVVFAAVGDSVVYDFRANNHSLTESTFEIPCEAKQAGGFKSGFLDNEADIPGEELFTVYVEDELPHWAYCGQKQPVNHCQKGMVHAINPPLTGDRTFEAFKNIATGGYKSPPIIPPYSAPLPPYVLPNATYPPAGYPSPTNYPTAAYPTPPYPTAVYPVSSVAPPYAAQTHLVNVGGGDRGLNYVAADTGKAYLDATPGDVIRFLMGSKKHSVTRSTFDTPCEANKVDVFATGPIENLDDIQDSSEFTKDFIVPEGEKPIWFYCGVANHCSAGMVFAINPGYQFEEFLAKAKATPPKEIETASSAYGSPTAVTDTWYPSETAGDAYPSSSAVSYSASADYPAASSTSEDMYSILPVETMVPVQY